MTEQNHHRILAGLASHGAKLELTTNHLCFLAALYLRADAEALASFSDGELVDLYEQSCDIVTPGAENPRKRATNAIQELRQQRFLTRVDGGGVAREGEYALTGLAAGVIKFFIADEALTRESLSLLTATLRVHLAETLAIAKTCDSAERWRSEVVARIRVTVGDLVAGIEQRQKGLDSQQAEVQAEIGQLLQESWDGAVERCSTLLDTTTSTLRELNEILLRDAHHFVALLQDIQALATAAGHDDVVGAVQRVIEHVDRIAAWGTVRQRAWSEYYQHVHRYLRDVVRLDPSRAISQRLRDRLATWIAKPHFTVVAAAPSIRLLRPAEGRVERPPVVREKEDRERPLELVEAGDIDARLEAHVRSLIAGGASDLAIITREVLVQVSVDRRYGVAGQVAELVARMAVTRSGRERAWRNAGGNLEIEDWQVFAAREAS